MLINVFNEQSALAIAEEKVQEIVQKVIEGEGQTCDEVNIYFVDTKAICTLHEEFFDDPCPTDCISFPMDEKDDGFLPYRILGEVFVCPETAIAYAKENKGDPYAETFLYIIHGVLHLLGYDDIDEIDITAMREAEARYTSI